MKVKGKSSHAGSSPERGRNALYEMAHQLLQTRDLSDPAIGVKMNWTVAHAGNNRNVIPADADAMADVRVLRVAEIAGGGGTDAAFASLKTTAPVVERFGLQGFGAHSNDTEYVVIDSIEPRLYLATRLIVDIAQGKGR